MINIYLYTYICVYNKTEYGDKHVLVTYQFSVRDAKIKEKIAAKISTPFISFIAFRINKNHRIMINAQAGWPTKSKLHAVAFLINNDK